MTSDVYPCINLEESVTSCDVAGDVPTHLGRHTAAADRTTKSPAESVDTGDLLHSSSFVEQVKIRAITILGERLLSETRRFQSTANQTTR